MVTGIRRTKMERTYMHPKSMDRFWACFFSALLVAGLFLINGCGNSSGAGETKSRAGNLSFSIKMPDSIEKIRTGVSMAASIDCAGLGIETVTAEIRDSGDKLIAYNADPWNCADGQGNLLSVEPGSDYTLNIFLKDSQGRNIMTGSKTGITVEPDTMTDAGTVEVKPVNFSIKSTSPADGATDVAVASPISVTFNYALDASTVTSESFVVSSSRSSVSGRFAFNTEKTVATFTPDKALSKSTLYTVSLKTAIKSAFGTALSSEYDFTFTTVHDQINVTYTSPLNLADNVSVSSAVAVTFNVPLDTSTVTSGSFMVSTQTGAVSGTLSFTAGNTIATWTATAGHLLRSTAHTVTLTKAIKSFAGIALSQDYVFSFTTGSTNNAPVINSISGIDPVTRSIHVGVEYPVNLQVNATDPDGDTLTYSIANLPADSAGDYYTNYTFDSTTGAYSWLSSLTGAYLVLFKVTDNGTPAKSAWRRAKILIDPVGGTTADYQPIIHIVSDDTEMKVRKTADAAVPLNIDFDPLHSSAMTAINFSMSCNSMRNPSIDEFFSHSYGTFSGLFSWPGPVLGNYYIDLSASYYYSPNMYPDKMTVLLTVGSSSPAPFLDPIGNRVARFGQELRFTVTATGTDISNTTFSATPDPAEFGASFNPATQVFTFTPSAGSPTEFSITFRAQDNTYPDSLYDTETITITVTK
jgi:hypothetical protein